MSSVGQIAAGRHEYGLRGGQKALYLFFAVGSGAIAALFFVMSAGDPHPLTATVVSADFAAAGLYWTMVALRSRLVIDGARVRVQGAVRMREFDLSQVEGYRTYKNRYSSFRVICLKDGARKIPLMNYATDDRLEEWFAGLKDLDQQDREQLLEKIVQDQELGATPEERREALARAKRVNIAAWVVDGAAAVALVWGAAEYRLAAMVVLALAPFAAAYLLYRQPLLYAIFQGRRDPRADVSPVLIISGFGLLLGTNKADFISMNLLFPFIAFAGLASMVAFYPAARKSPRLAATLMGLCFLSAFYGWGLAESIDVTADRSTPQVYTAQVLGGHVSRGSRSTSYYLELEPWGPYEAVNTQMKVSRGVYFATQPGDIICLALHSGALHAPWYEPVACENVAR
jgi:hypothetical protein